MPRKGCWLGKSDGPSPWHSGPEVLVLMAPRFGPGHPLAGHEGPHRWGPNAIAAERGSYSLRRAVLQRKLCDLVPLFNMNRRRNEEFLRGIKGAIRIPLRSFQYLRRPGCTAKLLCLPIASGFESHRLHQLSFFFSI